MFAQLTVKSSLCCPAGGGVWVQTEEADVPLESRLADRRERRNAAQRQTHRWVGGFAYADEASAPRRLTFPLTLSVRSKARGGDGQRSDQPSRQQSRQQGQQPPRQWRLGCLGASGRSLRLLRHFRHAEEARQRSQTVQDPDDIKEEPQLKDPRVYQEVNPAGETVLPRNSSPDIHPEGFLKKNLHYDWWFFWERRRRRSEWITLYLLSKSRWPPVNMHKRRTVLVRSSQTRICGVNVNFLFPL